MDNPLIPIYINTPPAAVRPSDGLRLNLNGSTSIRVLLAVNQSPQVDINGPMSVYDLQWLLGWLKQAEAKDPTNG